MDSIESYFNHLLDSCNLRSKYNYTLSIAALSIFVHEGFYILAILGTWFVGDDLKKLKILMVLLLGLLLITIPLEYYYEKIKREFWNDLERCNKDFFLDLLNTTDRVELIRFNIYDFYPVFESMNWGLQLYYESKVAQVKLIPNLVTVIISAFRVNILVITGILVLVNAILWFRAGTFFKETEELQDDNYQIMSELRDYVNLSKNMWINGTTNLDYFGNTFNRYLNNSTTIAQSYRTLELLNGATVFGVALYLAWTNYAKSTPADFFVYLLIYKIQAQLGKLNRRFQMVKDLFKKAPQVPQLSSRGEVQKIKIQELVNQTPLLRVSTPLEFQRGDHVLVHGKSGAGKTTFFNLWKGILMPEKAKVSLDDTMMPHGFHSFSDDIYYTIQSFKDLPRASLVDVVTNYSPAPNLDLVRKCLETACLDELYNVDKNPMVLASDDYSRLSL